MSRSYRTQKEAVHASRRLPRHRDGALVLPRVIERAPAPGDTHPLPKETLLRILPQLPAQYLYGLDRVELRARRAKVGYPFGSYWPDEKAIILYSLPPVWHLPLMALDFRLSLLKFRATIEEVGKRVRVSWPEPDIMAFWFYCEVLAHELGHHFVQQYRHKNGRYGSREHEELVANLHARRFFTELLRSRRRRKESAT